MEISNNSPLDKRQRQQVGLTLREYRGVAANLVTAFVIGFFLYHILYILGLFSTRYFFLLGESHRAISLGLVLALTFLLVPSGKHVLSCSLAWYDVVFMLICVMGCFYMAANIISIMASRIAPTSAEVILGVLVIFAVLEGVRRTSGIALALLMLLFILYAKFCNYFPGAFYGRGYSFERVIAESYFSYHGIFGIVSRLFSTVIVVFVMFGGFLQVSGAGRFFIDLSLSLAGHLRGGPAKMAVLASALFGTINGSAAANVATTGVLTIPMMIKTGQRPYFAAAVEAVASTGGIIMPPIMGMVAFLVAEFLDIPYLTVCFAAVVPAILYYIALYWQIDFEAAKRGLKGIPRVELPSIKKTLMEGWLYLVPIAVLVFFLAGLRYPPSLSCLYGIGSLLLVSVFKKEMRFSWKKITEAFETSMSGILILGAVCAAVGILIACMTLTGVPLRLTGILTELSGGHLLPLLLIAGIVSIILGAGLPALATYTIVAVTIAPALINFGVQPIVAHMFILYYGLSHVITPPVCVAVYISSAIAKSNMWRTGFQAVLLGIVIFLVPLIFVYKPTLLMIGEPTSIALAIVTAVIGVTILAAGVSGYLLKRASWLQRVLLIAAGLMLMMPGIKTNIYGIVAVGVILLWQGVIPRLKNRSQIIT
jgi:TRAP transporter 4TM/12TM fusion protein